MPRNNGNYRITLFISSLSGGGAERVVCNLSNYLQENGCSVDLITMSDKKDTYVLNRNINKICLLDRKERSGKIRDFLLRRKRLKEYVIKNQDVDCYIVMLPITTFMLMQLKRYTNSKMIFSERCNPNSYNFLKKILMKYAARRCDGLVTQTKKISEWYGGVRNKTVIPNAINKDVTLLERDNIEDKIVAVGRLEKQKNYPMLIEAFNVFIKKYPKYKLEIYGEGSEKRNIVKLINKYKMDENIKLMGYVNNISDHIVNATCFVMTSNYEGMSNALIEAMCIGIPCIVTDCSGGGAKELIKNAKNGFLIEKGDVSQLIKRMCKVVDDDNCARRLSNNAKKLREILNPETIYSRWLRFIVDTIRKENHI